MADDLSSSAFGAEPHGRRRVYEPTLLPPRKKRRSVSRWLILALLLLVLGGIYYFLQSRQHARRFVPTAGKIAWAADAGSGPRLWLAASDGTGAQPLAPSLAAFDPAFSPDGSSLAFVSSDKNGVRQIWTVDADGQKPIQTTRNSNAKTSPSYAPTSNTLLGFLSSGALSVWDLATGDTRRVLPAPVAQAHPTSSDDIAPAAPSATVLDFAWQPGSDPASQGLAAVEDRGGVETLALLPTWGGAALETQNGQADGTPLAAADTLSLGWSPDGGLLAVGMIGVQGAPLSLLALYDKQGHPIPHPPVAIKDRAAGPQNPVFSPDGATLVFELWRQPTLADRRCLGLYAVPVDASAPPRPLYKGDAENARFLPDGQAVLFRARRKDGGFDLMRVTLNGTNLARVSDGKTSVTAFAISPQAATK